MYTSWADDVRIEVAIFLSLKEPVSRVTHVRTDDPARCDTLTGHRIDHGAWSL